MIPWVVDVHSLCYPACPVARAGTCQGSEKRPVSIQSVLECYARPAILVLKLLENVAAGGCREKAGFIWFNQWKV